MAAQFDLQTFADSDALAAAAAALWSTEVRKRTSEQDAVTVALSGGRIAQKLFTAMVRLATAQPAALDPVHFFWADERCVLPYSPASNYFTAMEWLFRPLGVLADRIHRIQGELGPVRAAAIAANDLQSVTRGQPLDIVFLGMGEDGHVASLFPNHAAANVARMAYIPVRQSPKPPHDRVSLSYDELQRARNVIVLISGGGKAEALSKVQQGDLALPLGKLIALRNHTLLTDGCETLAADSQVVCA